MTYVVVENCIKCKYMDCVEVCPVDCFYEGANMLVIHPDECIDCGVCEPECPAEAIKPDTEPDLAHWLKLNADYAKTVAEHNLQEESRPPTGRNLTVGQTNSPISFRPNLARAIERLRRPGRLLTGRSVNQASAGAKTRAIAFDFSTELC